MRKLINRTSFLGLALVLLLVILSGCKPGSVSVGEADAGKEITLKQGQSLVVSLPGNPSTGYSWEVQEVDVALLEQVGEAEFASDDTALVGAGGKLTLTFKALSTGKTSLVLVYHRPWETDVEPLQTFSITVVIE